MGCLHNWPGLGAHGFEFNRPLSWVIPTPLVLGLALAKRLRRPQWKISGCVIDLLQRPLVFILLSLHKWFWGNKWPCLESYIAKNLQMASRSWHGLRLIARKKLKPSPPTIARNGISLITGVRLATNSSPPEDQIKQSPLPVLNCNLEKPLSYAQTPDLEKRRGDKCVLLLGCAKNATWMSWCHGLLSMRELNNRCSFLTRDLECLT